MNNSQQNASMEVTELMGVIMELFPDISLEFLKTVCGNKENVNDNINECVNMITDTDYPKQKVAEIDMQNEIKNLKMLFPKVDPSYLGINCRKLIHNRELFNDFILNLSKAKDYPTKKDYIEKRNKLKEITTYTIDFEAKKFLEIIPEPKEYFSKNQIENKFLLLIENKTATNTNQNKRDLPMNLTNQTNYYVPRLGISNLINQSNYRTNNLYGANSFYSTSNLQTYNDRQVLRVAAYPPNNANPINNSPIMSNNNVNLTNQQASGSNETSSANLNLKTYIDEVFKFKFHDQSVENIFSVLRQNNYNLMKSYEQLSRTEYQTNNVWVKRRSNQISFLKECENIRVLQEITYIRYMDKIEKTYSELKETKAKKIAEARKKHELLTCLCCFDDEVLAEDVISCLDGHIFCKTCTRRNLEIKIGENVDRFECLTDCKYEFGMKSLRGLIKKHVFDKIILRRQLNELKLADIEELKTCPFCDYFAIVEPDQKIFKCENKDCLVESCLSCGEVAHVPLRCDEVESDLEVKARTYIENKMSEAMIRTCVKCNIKFIKHQGCNFVVCPKCNTAMCYECKSTVCRVRHTTTDENVIHRRDIEKGAQEAKVAVLQQNPNLKLKYDPTENK